MKARVTAEGLLIPKRLLEGIQEVEIHKEKDLILIVPLVSDDLILQLGKSPIVEELNNVSECHDQYIYQS